jgi:hypothetical protein
MEDIIDIIVTETTNTIEITAQPNDEIIDVNIIDNREDVTLNVTPTVVEININSLTSNFGVEWGDITGTLADQTDLNNALALKANLVGGKVPASELPSYVDDVVEVANFAALPATGETGKIYITLDNNKIYRWSGSVYVEIADSTAVWGAITGTLSSQTDLQSALNAKVAGTGTSGQVAFWNGTSSVTGDNGLFWDNTNKRLGVGTIIPSAKIQLNTDLAEDLFRINNPSSDVTRRFVIRTIDGGLGTEVLITNRNSTASLLVGSNSGENVNGIGLLRLDQEYGIGGIGNSTAIRTRGNLVPEQNNVNDLGRTNRFYRSGFFGTSIVSLGNALIGPTFTDAGFRLDVNGTARVQGAFTGTTATFTNTGIGIGLGVTLNNASGDGVRITHLSGRAFNIQSSGGGFGILINNETASTSAPFTIQKQGLDKITFTDGGAGTFSGLLSGVNASFTNSGSSDTVGITHSSGSGIALNITKGGNGEGIYVNKSSGSGNAVTIVGTLNATTLVKNGGTSTQFLKADGSVDSTAYQAALTNPVTGTGTSGIVAKFNGTSTITDSIIYDNGTRVSIGANVTTSNTFTAVASTTSAYAVVAQASGAANGFWAVLSGTGEIFRGQTNGGSYFIVNNGGNAFLNGNLNIGDFGSTSFKLNVIGTANITGALSGTSATFSGNFGIGTASPSVYANLNTLTINGTNGSVIDFKTGEVLYGELYSLANEMRVDAVGASGTLKLLTNSVPRLTIASTGAATFSSSVTTSGNNIFNNSGGRAIDAVSTGVLFAQNGGAHNIIFGDGNVRYYSLFTPSGAAYGSIRNFSTSSDILTFTSAGNVGIGTTAPAYLLDLWSTSATLRIRNITAPATGGTSSLLFEGINNFSGVSQSFINSIQAGNSGATQLVFGTSGTSDATATERVRINSTGAFILTQSTNSFGTAGLNLINTSTNVWGILNGGDNNMYLGYNNAAVGVFTTSGAYIALSDQNKKKDIELSNIGLSEVMQLKPTLYRMKSDESEGQKELGFIAQDVKSVIPNAYVESGDFIGLNFNPIVAALTKAVQELKAKIDILENK